MLRSHALYPTVAERYVHDIGIAANTRRDYLKALRLLQGRLPAGTRMAEITPEDVADFVEYREDGQPRADESRAKMLGLVHSIFDWAMDPEVDLDIRTNPAARLRIQGRRSRGSYRPALRKTWLAKTQAQALVASIRGDGSRPADVRDAFVVAMYLYTGLRCAELIRCRWRDVDFATGTHGVIHVIRKGGKAGEVALNSAARRLLFDWRSRFIEAVGPDIDGLRIVPRVYVESNWAPNCGSQRIRWDRGLATPNSIRRMLKARSVAFGVHLKPHDLRRSYAGMLEDAGANLREIQLALGHARLATTERYLEQRTKLPAAAEALDFG